MPNDSGVGCRGRVGKGGVASTPKAFTSYVHLGDTTPLSVNTISLHTQMWWLWWTVSPQEEEEEDWVEVSADDSDNRKDGKE